MTCEKCGTPTELVKQSGGVKSGKYKEVYECVHGHRGYIHGEASNPPQQWTKYGTVFEHE